MICDRLAASDGGGRESEPWYNVPRDGCRSEPGEQLQYFKPNNPWCWMESQQANLGVWIPVLYLRVKPDSFHKTLSRLVGQLDSILLLRKGM